MISELAFIQWVQLIDALAWTVAIFVFAPSLGAMWKRQDTVIDLMAPPIILIAINQIWANTAWLLFPRATFIPNELFLWTAVHTFSVICVVLVCVTYRRAAVRGEP